MRLLFVETEVFTRRIRRLGLEDELRQLQGDLLANPVAGAVDPGTGGLRKIRMGDSTRGVGKRGGARVHYLYLPEPTIVYLIFVYGKGEQDTLAPDQKKDLRRVVDQIRETWAGKHGQTRP